MLDFFQTFSKKFNDVVNEASIISVTDSKGIIEYVSDEFCRVSLYKREELIWKSHNIIRHPDMSSKVFENMWRVIQSWKKWKWVIKNKKKNWDYYRVKSVIVPMKNDKWKIINYMAVRSDITKLVDSINEFNNYKKAIETSSYFIKLDSKGQIKYFSKNFINALWYTEGEIFWKSLLSEIYFETIATETKTNLDKFYHDILGISYVETSSQNLETAIKTKKVWKWILKNKTKFWTYIWCNATIVPILDLDKKIKEYIIIENDVTDLEIAKQKLKNSYWKLKELDDRKSDFLNIASHELRTPMTSIKWYISMMIDGDFWEVSSEIKWYLSKILDSNTRLINLVNDMLDISKLESSRITFDNLDLDIISIINEVIDDINPLAINKKQTITFEKEVEKFVIEADYSKLKQVIINLVWNAIKFTPDWWNINIVFTNSCDDFQIDVIDTWIWISKENQQVIFEKFWQVKNSLTRDINWTWLWLSIAKNIIERMGGKIFVESKEWIWSKFSFKLPIKFSC